VLRHMMDELYVIESDQERRKSDPAKCQSELPVSETSSYCVLSNRRPSGDLRIDASQARKFAVALIALCPS
jgi:hypothetical protein